MTRAGPPRIERSFTLRWKSDWGAANMTRIAGWLAQEIGDRAGPHTRSAIWTGRGYVDNVRAVGRGEVDVGIATPAPAVALALDGRGPYGDEPFPDLRALGLVPQRDRMVMAVRADTGVRSFADLRERKLPLRITTGPDDGEGHVGLAARRLMAQAGVPEDDLLSWGGSYLDFEYPWECFAALQAGQADAVIQEAIMGPWWTQVADEIDLAFLPIEEEVLGWFEREWGWPRAELPAGYLRGVDAPLPCLDFSDFVVFTRSDLADDVAHLIAWCMGETRERLERQYRHIPPERCGVTYPLVPAEMGRTPFPLHPGAARYYDSLPST